MFRCFMLVILCAAPLGAAYESNFGRVILSESDLIVHAVASATRTRAGATFRVELTVQEVVYGDSNKDEVSVFYGDRELISEEGAVQGLFALKELAEGGFSLVGKPVVIDDNDPEEDLKLRVAREFVDLEGDREDDQRTKEFWDLLSDHILLGGYAAQNAAVELMFVARDRGSIITEDRFDSVVSARENALAQLTEQTRKDLKLAFQGLVEAKVKRLKFKHVRRGDDKETRRNGAEDLVELFKEYPRAFLERDATLCDALAKASDDSVLRSILKDLAARIRSAVKDREADEDEEEAEKRRRIEHAKSG